MYQPLSSERSRRRCAGAGGVDVRADMMTTDWGGPGWSHREANARWTGRVNGRLRVIGVMWGYVPLTRRFSPTILTDRPGRYRCRERGHRHGVHDRQRQRLSGMSPISRGLPSRPVSTSAGVALLDGERGAVVAIGIQKLSAGAWYEHLTRQNAAMDVTGRGHSALSDYCSAKGESPGHLYGGGLAGVVGRSTTFTPRSRSRGSSRTVRTSTRRDPLIAAPASASDPPTRKDKLIWPPRIPTPPTGADVFPSGSPFSKLPTSTASASTR